jgi:hypothetical protein
MIHGYAINKRTPALLATSQTGSARDRQLHHHSPVAAALSTRVLLCCETTEPLPQGNPDSHKDDSGLALLKNAESRQTASRYAERSIRCPARCSAVPKEERSTALFRATVSADSQPDTRYAERTARYPAGAPGSEHFSAVCYKIVRGCRATYRHPTVVTIVEQIMTDFNGAVPEEDKIVTISRIL